MTNRYDGTLNNVPDKPRLPPGYARLFCTVLDCSILFLADSRSLVTSITRSIKGSENPLLIIIIINTIKVPKVVQTNDLPQPRPSLIPSRRQAARRVAARQTTILFK